MAGLSSSSTSPLPTTPTPWTVGDAVELCKPCNAGRNRPEPVDAARRPCGGGFPVTTADDLAEAVFAAEWALNYERIVLSSVGIDVSDAAKRAFSTRPRRWPDLIRRHPRALHGRPGPHLARRS